MSGYRSKKAMAASRESGPAKKYEFHLEDGSVQHVVAQDFKQACLAWEKFGKDPRDIKVMKEIG